MYKRQPSGCPYPYGIARSHEPELSALVTWAHCVDPSIAVPRYPVVLIGFECNYRSAERDAVQEWTTRMLSDAHFRREWMLRHMLHHKDVWHSHPHQWRAKLMIGKWRAYVHAKRISKYWREELPFQEGGLGRKRDLEAFEADFA